MSFRPQTERDAGTVRADERERDNDNNGLRPFRHLRELQALLHVLHTGAPEGGFPDGRVLQPLRGAHAARVLPDDAVHESRGFRQMFRGKLRRQHDDTRMPQPSPLCQQGLQGRGHRRQGHDGLVPRLQAPPAVQRPWGSHDILSYRRKRGRQG